MLWRAAENATLIATAASVQHMGFICRSRITMTDAQHSLRETCYQTRPSDTRNALLEDNRCDICFCAAITILKIKDRARVCVGEEGGGQKSRSRTAINNHQRHWLRSQIHCYLYEYEMVDGCCTLAAADVLESVARTTT